MSLIVLFIVLLFFFNGTQEAEMTGSHYEDIGGDEVSIKTLPEKKKNLP